MASIDKAIDDYINSKPSLHVNERDILNDSYAYIIDEMRKDDGREVRLMYLGSFRKFKGNGEGR